jgi:ribosomal protein S18 acetylase RimI-like enzyme
MHFREATSADTNAIFNLYIKVAAREGGIARLQSEITKDYVASFVDKASANGLIIVCEDPDNPGEIIAEIHAYRNGLKVFDHILGDLTVVVDPEYQGRKIGRTLFSIFLNEIAQNRSDIGKVELITRESNVNAISLYQSLGFRIEGRMEMRVKTSGGCYEADIPMGWQNPNYEF